MGAELNEENGKIVSTEKRLGVKVPSTFIILRAGYVISQIRHKNLVPTIFCEFVDRNTGHHRDHCFRTQHTNYSTSQPMDDIL
jgi:hypothetical protein